MSEAALFGLLANNSAETVESDGLLHTNWLKLSLDSKMRRNSMAVGVLGGVLIDTNDGATGSTMLLSVVASIVFQLEFRLSFRKFVGIERHLGL